MAILTRCTMEIVHLCGYDTNHKVAYVNMENIVKMGSHDEGWG